MTHNPIFSHHPRHFNLFNGVQGFFLNTSAWNLSKLHTNIPWNSSEGKVMVISGKTCIMVGKFLNYLFCSLPTVWNLVHPKFPRTLLLAGLYIYTRMVPLVKNFLNGRNLEVNFFWHFPTILWDALLYWLDMWSSMQFPLFKHFALFLCGQCGRAL